jgi:hypothetical protein
MRSLQFGKKVNVKREGLRGVENAWTIYSGDKAHLKTENPMSRIKRAIESDDSMNEYD